jgi:hypothetical protein
MMRSEGVPISDVKHLTRGARWGNMKLFVMATVCSGEFTLARECGVFRIPL